MKYISMFAILLGSILLYQCSPKNKSMSNQENDAQSFRANMPKPGPAPKIELGKYEKFTLANGLQVIVVQNNKLPRVSFQLLVDAPPISQGDAVGFIDFAGEMLTRGTNKRSKAELDLAIDFIGASLNSSGSGIFASSLSKHKETVLQIMSEVLLEPSFPEDEFEKSKKQRLSGLTASKDDPNAIAANVGQVLRYGKDHPYGEIVTENSTNKVNLAQAKKYYMDYWRPNISYLAIVGDITPSEAKALAEKYFGKWEKKEVEKPKFNLPAFPQHTTVDFVDKPGAIQSVVSITYPVELFYTSKDRVAASLMNAIFGGVFSSRINMNLRERNAYTYGARSSLNADRFVGSFSAGASVGNNVTENAVQELLNEINTMRNERVTDDEFRLAKNVLSGEFARSLERPQTVASFALNIARFGLPADYYDTYLEQVDKVTIQDVQNAAVKYLRPDNARILIVGNKREVAPKVARFAHNKKVDFYDVYGNKIEEDGFKVPAGLTAEKVVEDYLQAIGGREAIKKIKTIEQTGFANLSGFDLTMNSVYLFPGKMAMSITAQGQVFQSVIVNGNRAKVSSMGQAQIVEGSDANEYIEQTRYFDELFFAEPKASLELVGVEIVEGKNAFVVEWTNSRGEKSLHYYDAESKLKLRSTSTRNIGDQIVTQTADFADYKAIDGIMFPFTNKVSGGGMPMPLVVKYKEIKVNGAIDASVFDF
jgi:zinc protease